MEGNRMYSKGKLIVILVGAISFFFTGVEAQETYKMNGESQIVIKGTSTIHDWESEANEVSGKASIEFKEGRVHSIDDLYVEIPVKSIKSGKSLMDSKTYEALEEEEHPVISFQQNGIDAIEPGQVVILGNLRIAGVTRQIALRANYTIHNSHLIFKGSLPVKMSEFEIKAPTAMMGTIKTGDELVLDYRGVFQISN